MLLTGAHAIHFCCGFLVVVRFWAVCVEFLPTYRGFKTH